MIRQTIHKSSGLWLALFLVVLAGEACALDLNKQLAFDIQPQKLATALLEFSHQAGVQVVVGPEVGEFSTAGVIGTRSIEDALKRLLDKSELGYTVVGEGAIAVGAKGTAVSTIASPTHMAQAEGTASGGSTAAQGESTKLEEVVVTAQKRQERLKDVPISITVLSGAQLDRSTLSGVNEELGLIAGVIPEKDNATAGTQISIRGVSASSPTGLGGSTVAYYLDSVPFGFIKTAMLPDADAYDLDRVEVLRGPQGTLYGASALNGVVRIFTHEPDLERFEVKTRESVSGTKGGDESYRGDAVVNIPLMEGKFAVRGDVGYNKIGGFIDRPDANQKDYNKSIDKTYRLKLKAQPTDHLKIGLGAWLARMDIAAGDIGSPEDTYPGTGSNVAAEQYDVYNGTIDYDFGPVSISSATSYIDYKNNGSIDYDIPPFDSFGYTALSLDLFANVLAEEVNIKSTAQGVWRWVVGAYYRDAKDRSVQRWPNIFVSPIDGSDLPVASTNTSKSYAVFGELTRTFLDDKLELTGGLRYFKDRVKNLEDIPLDGDFSRPLKVQSANFDKATPRAVLTYKPNHDATFYLSYGQGYRSGFLQEPVIAFKAQGFPPVKPDTLTNYEVGAKGLLFDRIAYEAAVYYMDWADPAENVFVNTQGHVCEATNAQENGQCFFAGINGVSASGAGIDLTLKARVTDRLTFSPAFSWNDLTWDEGVVASSGQVFAVKGGRVPYSAKYTLGGSAEYRFPIMQELEGAFSLSGRYSSPISGTVDAGSVPESKLTIDAGLSMDADRWSMLVFANNVTNERRNAAAFANPLQRNFNLRQRPRTVGVQIEYRLHR